MNILEAYMEAIKASIGTDDTLAKALADRSKAKAFISKHQSNHRQGLLLYQDLQVELEKEAILYYKEEPTNMRDFLDSFDKETIFLKVYRFEDDSYISLNYSDHKSTTISEISEEKANKLKRTTHINLSREEVIRNVEPFVRRRHV